jgi:hypothetical protein
MKPRVDCYRVVCWRLSRRCNRACAFCLSTSGPRFDDPGHDPHRIMRRLVELGVEKISYSGGEPLMYAELPALVDAGEELGVAQSLTTNGDLLETVIPSWFGLLEHVKLSFYGSREGHDRLMGAGHYDLQLRLARRIPAEADISVSANYLLSAVSCEQQGQFLLDAARAGFYHVVFQTYIPTRRGRVDTTYMLGSHESAIAAVARTAADFMHDFPGGIRVHDFSQNDWLIVLDEQGRLTLPANHPVQPDHVLGGVFDDLLTLPAKAPHQAADVLARVWSVHAGTDAVVTLDPGRWSNTEFGRYRWPD